MLKTALRPLQRTYAAVRRFFGDAFFERSMGIETNKQVSLEELGLAAPGRGDYDPSPWLALRRVLAKRDISGDDVFIDFGSGKGRVVVQAASYPFKRIIGIELSPELHAIAKANVDRSLTRLRCRNVELVNQDVLDYEIPDDVTVAYFYNPFDGETFAKVIDRLVTSVRRRPRTLKIIYVNPAEEQAVLRVGAKLTRVARGLGPDGRWARRKTIHLYTLSAGVH
jgi:16S rRNA G966 N2-methylase RsmD